MAIQKKLLRVLPNPWTYIDHLGRPAGVCPCDPNEHTPDRRWVGAHIEKAEVVRPARIIQIGGQSFTQSSASHDITWTFSTEAVDIPNTAYYRQKIGSGELVAADSVTAEACGISRESFEQPSSLLAKLKSAAIKQFDAENGDGAYAELNVSAPAPVTAPKTSVVASKGDS